MKVIGNANRQETGHWLNNRAENAHQPFRRWERTMLNSRRMRSLQKFICVHASVHNHFNQERHLYSCDNFKLNRDAALSEWRKYWNSSIWKWNKYENLSKIVEIIPKIKALGRIE